MRFLPDGVATAEVTALVERQIRLLDRPGQGMLVHDAGHQVLYINFNLREFVGIDWPMQSQGLAPGWSLVGLDGLALPDDDLPRSHALRTGRPVNGRRVGVREPDGEVRWVMASAYPVNDHTGTTVAAITTVTGAWDRDPERTAARVAGDGPVTPAEGSQAVVACDGAGRVTYVNPEAAARYGCDASAARGRPLFEVVTWDVTAEQIPPLALDGSVLTPWSGEVWSREPDGACRPINLTVTPIVLEDGSVVTSTVAIDISERRAAHEARLHASLHDPLTGLANRALLVDSIQDPTGGGTQDGPAGSVVLALIDIDDLRVVNDGLGRGAGDRVIRSFARALHAAAHRGDTVGHLGNGSFGVVCHHAGRHGDVRSYVDRLRRSAAAPVTVDGRPVTVRSSVGVVTCRQHPCDAEDLIHRADVALSRAKVGGKDRCGVYDEAMALDIARELELEAILHDAIAHRSVTVGYQPIVDLDSQAVVGAEALLRLTGADGEPIAALELIEVAERRNLIGELGLLVLEAACWEAARWQREWPERTLSVSVNVSAAQLDDPSLADEVIRVLEASGLDPARLGLEMTETILMRDSDHAASQLARLKMAGIGLSADDFGAGYSSLAYLKRFPLDVIKADRSFVAGLPDSPEDVGVVGAIMGVAAALGLQVVAEGVEHHGQLACLRALGCDLGQGFLWGRAVPGPAFGDLVTAIESRDAIGAGPSEVDDATTADVGDVGVLEDVAALDRGLVEIQARAPGWPPTMAGSSTGSTAASTRPGQGPGWASTWRGVWPERTAAT